MKVLMFFNSYLYKGGEASVALSESQLLRKHDHRVIYETWDNAQIRHYPFYKKLSLVWTPIWSFDSYNRVLSLIRKERPDIVHVQNFFPLISPSVFHACSEAGVAVVYTLHNYRLLCANGIFFRAGDICKECLYHGPWRALRYGCYRESRLLTIPVFFMQSFHNHLSTWQKAVDLFIAPSHWVKKVYLDANFPANKIVVKPHFVDPDPGFNNEIGTFALFVGQFAKKKGIHELLDAWRHIESPLKMLGGGALEGYMKDYIRRKNLCEHVEIVGYKPTQEVLSYMRQASFVMIPSIFHEGFPRVIVESFACGVPVLASNIEPLNELIEHRRTGLLFKPGNVAEMVNAIKIILGDSSLLKRMKSEARKEYEEKYTGERNHRLLLNIYSQAIKDKHGGFCNEF